MKRILSFYSKGIPTDDELKEALEVVNNGDCYVKLEYTVWGYPYSIFISPEDTFEKIKDRMPRYYGA